MAHMLRSLHKTTTSCSSTSILLCRRLHNRRFVFSNVTSQNPQLPDRKVAVLGAAGRVGQHVALLLKLDPYVTHLALYDTSPAIPRIASYVRNLPTKAKVAGYVGKEQLGKALDNPDLVIITAGVPKLEDQTQGLSDLFKAKAGVLVSLCHAIVEHCPLTTVHLVSNPKCSLPIAVRVFQKAGTYDWEKVWGVSNEHLKTPPSADELSNEDLRNIIEITDDGGIEFVQGPPRDVLSIAYASAFIAHCRLTELNECNRYGHPFLDSTSSKHEHVTYTYFLPPLQPSSTFPRDYLEWTPEREEEEDRKYLQEEKEIMMKYDVEGRYPFIRELQIADN